MKNSSARQGLYQLLYIPLYMLAHGQNAGMHSFKPRTVLEFKIKY